MFLALKKLISSEIFHCWQHSATVRLSGSYYKILHRKRSNLIGDWLKGMVAGPQKKKTHKLHSEVWQSTSGNRLYCINTLLIVRINTRSKSITSKNVECQQSIRQTNTLCIYWNIQQDLHGRPRHPSRRCKYYDELIFGYLYLYFNKRSLLSERCTLLTAMAFHRCLLYDTQVWDAAEQLVHVSRQYNHWTFKASCRILCEMYGFVNHALQKRYALLFKFAIRFK